MQRKEKEKDKPKVIDENRNIDIGASRIDNSNTKEVKNSRIVGALNVGLK